MIDERIVRTIIEVIGSLVLVVVLFAVCYDIWLEGRNESLGLRVARWASRYPLFAVVLIVLLGAMLGHFFTQPLPTDP
jgi:hypothetical protein